MGISFVQAESICGSCGIADLVCRLGAAYWPIGVFLPIGYGFLVLCQSDDHAVVFASEVEFYALFHEEASGE